MEMFKTHKNEGHKSVTDIFLSEENPSPITLFDENNAPFSFDPIALIPHGEELYTILEPLFPMQGREENEVVIFKINDPDGEEYLTAVTDTEILDTVFDKFCELAGIEE